ncbi:hypothetical protein IFM89_038703 [Coptis chinensis]|uniref:Plant heme peroxidase family profile domain-containing protein n=1 Tax=Coptis chinensis TaxID=261450 RepID=A0A835LKN5_9MAGN|nr:hypothetical protein IFM89_038703 [Coptis chinensis]
MEEEILVLQECLEERNGLLLASASNAEQGCNVSILISTKAGSAVLAKKDAQDNKHLVVEAFDGIKNAKALVESKCPGIVSCADIVAIAARDFVHLVEPLLSGGTTRYLISFSSHSLSPSTINPNPANLSYVASQVGGPYYQVKTGRWDGKFSLASRVSSNIPRANSTIDELLKTLCLKRTKPARPSGSFRRPHNWFLSLRALCQSTL